MQIFFAPQVGAPMDWPVCHRDAKRSPVATAGTDGWPNVRQYDPARSGGIPPGSVKTRPRVTSAAFPPRRGGCAAPRDHRRRMVAALASPGLEGNCCSQMQRCLGQHRCAYPKGRVYPPTGGRIGKQRGTRTSNRRTTADSSAEPESRLISLRRYWSDPHWQPLPWASTTTVGSAALRVAPLAPNGGGGSPLAYLLCGDNTPTGNWISRPARCSA